MSGFFKGIFGGKDENEQLLHEGVQTAAHEEEEIEQLKADVRGTVDTHLDESLMADEAPATESKVEVQPEPEPEPMTMTPATTTTTEGEFSAETVWRSGGVTDVEQATVNRAQTLLMSLPESTPDAVKRQIVEASLKAFDVSIGDIVSGAGNEITALKNYIDETNQTTSRFIEVSNARIEALEAEIAGIRDNIRESEDERDQLVGAATEVIDDVQPVLDFFSPGKTSTGSLGSSLPAPATPVVAAGDTTED